MFIISLLFLGSSFQIIDNSCSSLYNLSAKAWGQYEFCGGDDYINLSKGFSSVVDALVGQLPPESIRFQCPVKQILWKDFYNKKDEVVYRPSGMTGIEINSNHHIVPNSLSQSNNIDASNTNDSEVLCRPNQVERDESFSSKPLSDTKHTTTCDIGRGVNYQAFDSRNPHYQPVENMSNSKYTAEKPRVETRLGEDSIDEIIVTCVDGSMYRTKQLIVTASLGYLKENHTHMFIPRLPEHWSKVCSFTVFSNIFFFSQF